MREKNESADVKGYIQIQPEGLKRFLSLLANGELFVRFAREKMISAIMGLYDWINF